MFNFVKFLHLNSHSIVHKSYSSSTIFALSSGLGKCGVAVIRMSGPHSDKALQQLTGLKELPQPRLAMLRSIRHPISKDLLDKGLILWFPGPKSFTGEDSCEFHVHGGIAVVNGILEALATIPNVKLAQPGEFTRRAFHNGKLDLTEVEGLSDLLQAETEAQRKQALLQTHGSLSKLYQKWRKTLINSVAHIEAHIDFEETDTLEIGLIEKVAKDIIILSQDIEKHLNDGRKGETLRNGVRTVILGEPNVGKSSLLNLLVQRPASIVTPISGTTRDIIEVTLNINGYPLVLADTAGLKSNTDDVVEQEGISRALETFKNSDLIILVIDFAQYQKWRKENMSMTFNDYVKNYTKDLNLQDLLDDREYSNKLEFKKPCLVVINKTDLDNKKESDSLEDVIKLSCKNEDGVQNLIQNIAKEMRVLCGDPSQEHPSMNQMRHRQHLTDCHYNLNLFLKEVSKGQSCDLVIMAEYLRRSLRSLGRLLGTVTSEEILDVIFRDFCIGK